MSLTNRRPWGRAATAAIGLVVLLGPIVAPSPAGAGPQPGPAVQIVVKMASVGTRASSVLSPIAGQALAAPADRYVLTLSEGQVASALAKLNSDPRVAFAERVRTMSAATVPNDPCFAGTGPCPAETTGGGSITSPNQPNLVAVNAPQAWSVTQGSPTLSVAVLDTGVNTGASAHPDLDGKIASEKVICTMIGEQCAPGQDLVGHGTHVSGIIAAKTNNGIGIAGLGWQTTVTMYKVLEDPNPNNPDAPDPTGGLGSTADIASAIYDAVNSGFRVINMSLSSPSCRFAPLQCGPDRDTQTAVAYAIKHGVVVVAAAGNGSGTLNGGSTETTYPAGYPGVVSVAATDNNRVVAGFSEFGPAANMAAPGVGVLSTWKDGNYAVDTGTSMAAPHVAAAAALVMARFPPLSGPQVVTQLENTSAPLGPGRSINGGFLDVNAAVTTAPSTGINGYAVAGADGAVYNFGLSPNEGSLLGQPLIRPVVGMASTTDHLGYWLVASDGGIFTFGDAGFSGSIGGHPLARPVVGMAPTSTGQGYWEVASDGGIFTFGSARFFGSTGKVELNRPVVGMARTTDNAGYWQVASDGGIFTFGDAAFLGSTGKVNLFRPIVGMAATPSGHGYWLVASDGGIFTFGDAGFYGSTGGHTLSRPIVGMVPTASGHGYWLVASDGGIFTFGDAGFYGSLGGMAIPGPIVAGAS